MTRRAVRQFRSCAILFWVVAVAWIVADPSPPSAHRLVVAAGITTTILWGLGACLMDLRVATQLALDAGRQQAQIDRAAID